MPHISVVVPLYNSENTIEACLQAIRSSDYKDYELIVVDDASCDGSFSMANKYADHALAFKKHKGRSYARRHAFEMAKGKIIVNIDSDVLIKADTLSKIDDYFVKHPNVNALTGMLSKKHPNENFLSQYKNLYMHYTFSRLPERVNFLYGSIFAIRDKIVNLCDFAIELAEDTGVGQKLSLAGQEIAFLKGLTVKHLKKYDLLKFIINDFQIPFYWAKIFMKYNGIKQLGKNKCGFAHAPKSQIASIILTGMIMISFILTASGKIDLSFGLSLLAIWFLINLRFLSYLTKEKNVNFGILSLFTTFLDNMIMGCGIASGFLAVLFSKAKTFKTENKN